ncbi:MAG: hypothetical protein LBG46_04860, partial [Elusimicrobiota bacterium]|nr:hypothetical protein [Elusimicrobiota bacterium]
MKYAKLLVSMFVLSMFVSVAVFAQTNQAKAKKSSSKTTSSKTSKPAVSKPQPVTVIVEEGEVVGGVDEGLNSGLERFIGVPLEIAKVKREDALKDPKYSGLNLD